MNSAQDAALVSVYIAFQMAGTLGFLVIVLTAALSSRVMRHPTWFSFCLSWATWGVSFSLLFYARQQTQLTSHTLCIVQSALVYTMPFLWVLMMYSVLCSVWMIYTQNRSHLNCPCLLRTLLHLIWQETQAFTALYGIGPIHCTVGSNGPNSQ